MQTFSKKFITSSPEWVKYIFAFGFALLAFIIHYIYQQPIGETRFLFFYPSVFIATWLLGPQKALVTLATCLLGATLIKYSHFPGSLFDSAEFFRFTGFTLSCLLVMRIIQQGNLAQEQLLERERRHRFATDSSQIGVWEVNFQGLKVVTSLQNDKNFGHEVPVVKWTIKTFLRHVHPDNRRKVIESIKKSFKTGELISEFKSIWPDHTTHWLKIIGKFEFDSNRRPWKMHGTSIDITKQKRTEEGLQKTLQYRDEFLSMASHELKTPLTALKLRSQMFLRTSSKTDSSVYKKSKVDLFVSETEKQVSRLVRLVDDMLDISRIRTGKLSIAKEPIDFCVMVTEVVERISPQFTNNGKNPPKIEQLNPCKLTCDRLRMEQVLTNLLNNAFRYGRGKPIKVRVFTTKNKIRVEVEDQGMGIAPHDLNRIFTRFQRAVPATEISGLGLGLYIAKQIVEAHGGIIGVISELNKGSTFWYELPLNPPA